jgi:hypothetical protein
VCCVSVRSTPLLVFFFQLLGRHKLLKQIIVGRGFCKWEETRAAVDTVEDTAVVIATCVSSAICQCRMLSTPVSLCTLIRTNYEKCVCVPQDKHLLEGER